MKLYELTAQYRDLEVLESSDDLPPEVIRDTLEGLEGQLQEKATNVALFIRNLESVADAIDEAAETMRLRGERLRKRAQSLQEYLLLNMQASGITKIESPYFTLAVRNNPPTVVIDDQSQIPKAYWRQPPVPAPVVDKQAVARDLKAGKTVPGCRAEQRQRLEVKL